MSVGTVIVKDIMAGGSTSSPQYLTNVNGTLFFSADNGINGTELRKTTKTIQSSGSYLSSFAKPSATANRDMLLVHQTIPVSTNISYTLSPQLANASCDTNKTLI